MKIQDLYKIYLRNPKVSTDTRKDPTGSIFFCLKGPNFDANGFAEEALKKGAAAVVSDDPANRELEGTIIVEDVLASLQELANYHRQHFSGTLIGLTGSNGKTTNKELITAVLSQKYSARSTKGNLNNHIGVPLTLLDIPADTEMVIIEMGANHQGEIRELSAICDPDYGMITNIGKAHLEGFGGIEGVKKGKKELYDHMLAKNGKIFINGDDLVLAELAGEIEKISFGTSPRHFVYGEIVDHVPFITFHYHFKESKSPLIRTQLVGAYNFANLMAAVCIGVYFGVDHKHIVTALESYSPTNNRSQFLNTGKNKVILDAYNANPSSMEVAIRNLAAMEGDLKLALLGQMLELGDTALLEHQMLINLAQSLQIEAILVGENFKNCDKKGFKHFHDAAQLQAHLQLNKIEDHIILLKGSRMVAMEKILESL